LTLFHTQLPEGEPKALEHNALRWITVQEIDQLAFCPADEVILERLKQ
jgi:8-oxo-dGTP diphosphatase